MERITQLRRELARARSALSERKGQCARLTRDRAGRASQADQLREQLQIFDQVVLLLQETSQHARETARQRIERLVTNCLQAVFGREYGFRIELTERAGRPEAEFWVVSGEGPERLETRPQDARGGGVVDIVSLALRLAMLETYRPRLDGPVVLDEPAKHVSEEFIQPAARFLKRISESFGRQVIMVTHHAHLAETSEIAYTVVLRDGRSVVARLTGTPT